MHLDTLPMIRYIKDSYELRPIRYDTIPRNTAIHCDTVQFGLTQCDTMQCRRILYNGIQSGAKRTVHVLLHFYSVLHTFKRDNRKLNSKQWCLLAVISCWMNAKVVQIDTHVTAHDLFEMGPYLQLSLQTCSKLILLFLFFSSHL